MKQQTILIVEQDTDIGRYYCGIFENKYKVVLTSSGRHAMRLARQSEDIHLALLEYRLPDASGLDVLREIKRYQPSVPVIIVTAYGDENVAVKAFRYGAKDYLKKPVAYEELIKRVEFYLLLKQADKNLRRTLCPVDRHHAAKIPLRDIASCQHINIQKALQFVDDAFTAKISLASAAERACLSRHHFSRAFKKATGTTYQEYLTGRRVEEARKLLKESSRTVTEIANAVGYSDINNLIRNFKKHTGFTPSEFRNCRDRSKFPSGK